ncbi:Thiol-disulfide isomerase or thioredoxin [Pedobacter sp. ok626]|uniref:TlpA disulfide reductase family protein n=1 Tax=Pedobacter sp. ok626 TaxID=1761882 RepID=UPI00088831BD|nr:TlpA disulfide reductase family protein [Pedobacter sp. ok626]SDL55132.1 Thiol-disulfide isomerase or thioredoxin [Pedobacter sp. ok626]
MKKQKVIFLLWSLFLAFGASAQEKSVIPKSIGEPAPPLYISKWLKGDSIAEFKKGQVYVVEFWATWCLPCIAGMPHLSDLARKYKKDVTVIGVSIFERGTTMPVIEKFVADKGDKMDYHVAAEKGKMMAEHWMTAYAERGIPFSFVVDREGRIAWCGPPKNLDQVLAQVVKGNWDIQLAAKKRKEYQRLAPIDGNNVVNTLNPYMGNPGRPAAALKKIDSMLTVEPGLKYFPKMGHFTFYSLTKTDQKKAVEFAREWFAANDYPGYSTVTDAVYKKEGLIPELYVLAAECYQAQLDNYPWSMNFPETYKNMAALYEKAGDKVKAKEMLKKAQEAPIVNKH